MGEGEAVGSSIEVILGSLDHYYEFKNLRERLSLQDMLDNPELDNAEKLHMIANIINAVYDPDTHLMTMFKEDYLLFVMKWS